MTQPARSSRTPATQAKRRPHWIVGGATILTFVALLYLIELIDQLKHHSLDDDGIRPLEADGLWGIIWAPFLHASWTHLNGNASFVLVLGFLMTLAGLSRFIWATTIIWIVGGVGTWLIGNIGAPSDVETIHIGASGLILGWLTFLLVFGFFTRNVWQIVIGLVVLFVYGGILLAVLPGTVGVSWQGHLSGAVAGLLAAYLLSAPERKSRALKKAGTGSPRLTS
jgi:membrane associated rhomboid family serine protease